MVPLDFCTVLLKGLPFIWSKSMERHKEKELKSVTFLQERKTNSCRALQPTSWEMHKGIDTCKQRKMKMNPGFYHLNAVLSQMPWLGDFYFRNCRNISLWIRAKILCGIASQTQRVWVAFHCLAPEDVLSITQNTMWLQYKCFLFSNCYWGIIEKPLLHSWRCLIQVYDVIHSLNAIWGTLCSHCVSENEMITSLDSVCYQRCIFPHHSYKQ